MSRIDMHLDERANVMPLTDILMREAEAAYGITGKLFRRLSDDELSWTPLTGRNWMTVGQLLMHCASFGCGKAVRGFVQGDWGMPGETTLDDAGAVDHVPPAAALPRVETVGQALELLAADRSLALNCIAAAGEANLLTVHCTAPWGGSELPLFEHLLQMIAHLDQHKGQLFYYLKLMGKEVDTCDLWGTPV